MDKQISQRINILRFWMTCAIAIYHVGSPNGPVNAWDNFLNLGVGYVFDHVLATLAMGYFFSVTGMLLFRNLSFSNMAEKLKKRTITLFVPYLLWQLIATVKRLIEGSGSLAHFLDKTLLLKPGLPDGALWYLYAVFILALLSPLLLPLLKNRYAGLAVVFAASVASTLIAKSDNAAVMAFFNYGYVSNTLFYVPCYLTGAYLGLHAEDGAGAKNLKYVVALLLAALVIDGLLPGFFKRMAERMLPLLLIYFFPLRPWMNGWKVYKLSFLVFAIHSIMFPQLRNGARALVGFVFPYAFAMNFGARMICLAVDFVLAALVYMLLKKTAPRVLDVLTGGHA